MSPSDSDVLIKTTQHKFPHFRNYLEKFSKNFLS